MLTGYRIATSDGEALRRGVGSLWAELLRGFHILTFVLNPFKDSSGS